MPVLGGPDSSPSTRSSLSRALPASPAAAPPPSSPSSPTRTLSPAAAAALARSQPAPRPTSRSEAHSARLDREGGDEFRPDRKDLLAFHRVLDSQFLPNASKAQAVETLSTIHTILTNLLSPPNPSQAHKYRHVRLSNPLIQRTLLSPASGSAKDFLVLCGWKREVKEFEEALVWRGGEGQVYRARCGKMVVEGKLKQAKEADEREKRYKESEKEAEAGESPRKEKALLAYEEDRLSLAERDKRERLVREARAALPPTPIVPRSTGPSPYLLPRSPPGTLHAITDPEAGTYDPPPSYGELHGRVLGSGEPPEGEDVGADRGVRMVSQQDIEDDDEEE
ncbi:PUB domain-containing protein [Rhodotorula toruloides]|uniref:PUB domain-containing protein n=1 Tax=Rhodotorula toruloides TaxID=5286 RepID=A0A511KHS4_RHOTO|nr:PUB domain-containing protein [Rhodotorula toruloides]